MLTKNILLVFDSRMHFTMESERKLRKKTLIVLVDFCSISDSVKQNE